MSMDDPLPPLRAVIESHGLWAKKSLGQNFLLDLNLTRRIARTAGSLEDARIYEVGPGPGGLTRALLMEGAGSVTAVERDPRCLAALQDVSAAYPGRLHLISGDALEIDEAASLPPGTGPIRIVANLPYNVGTQLLIRWLTATDWPPFWSSLTLMFQKEVAERIVARPGGKDYGRLAVLAQFRCDTRLMFEVNRAAFTPPPKVTSAIVHLVPKAPVLDGVVLRDLERVVAAAFNQRRKMLRSSLKAMLQQPEAYIEMAGLNPEMRAEEVDVLGFARLAKAIARSAA